MAVSRTSIGRKKITRAKYSELSQALPASPQGYSAASRAPLTSLLFVLPLLIVHEWGSRHFSMINGSVSAHRVVASTLIEEFFHWFGAQANFLPAMTVVAVLLCWHIARVDAWVFNIPALAGMLVESLAWAIPLIAVYFLVQPTVSTPPVSDWRLLFSLYLGAGVYEELVFRLAAFAVLSLLLIDGLKVPPKVAWLVIVPVAASLFSFYHLLGGQAVPWQAFVFTALRGIYYGIIFLERGFGLSVGCHTAYDLIFLSFATHPSQP